MGMAKADVHKNTNPKVANLIRFINTSTYVYLDAKRRSPVNLHLDKPYFMRFRSYAGGTKVPFLILYRHDSRRASQILHLNFFHQPGDLFNKRFFGVKRLRIHNKLLHRLQIDLNIRDGSFDGRPGQCAGRFQV